MANIFKSKEVYKHVPGINSGDRLYAVRGMYVSGEHKVPYYIDSYVYIKSISSKQAKVVDFTHEYFDTGDHVLNVIGVDVSSLKVAEYTSASTSCSDKTVNLINVDASPLTIVAFNTVKENLNSDHVLNLISVDIENPLEITMFNNKKIDTIPDHTVCVKNIITTKAVVSD